MFCIFVGYFSDFAFPHTDEGGCFSIKECFDGCGSQCGSKDGVFGAWLAASLDEAQDSGADVDVSTFLEPFAEGSPLSAFTESPLSSASAAHPEDRKSVV